MKHLYHIIFIGWFEKLLHTKETNIKIFSMKEKANKQIDNLTNSLNAAGKLQHKIIQQTITYYIGKAIGSIK